MVSSQPGFTSGVWLAPDAQSEGLSIALFETEAQARSQQITAPPDGPVEVLSVEIREVFAQA